MRQYAGQKSPAEDPCTGVQVPKRLHVGHGLADTLRLCSAKVNHTRFPHLGL